jgi:predicted  nucleic acid-binding Zn-ribbon protein
MSTETTDSRLDQVRDRIDRLEAKAQAGGTETEASIKSHVDGLRRQEESARASFSHAVDTRASGASERAQAADDEFLVLETRLGAAEQALAAELAEDSRTFSNAMEGYLGRVKALFDRLDARAPAKAGAAHDQTEASMSELRRSRDTVAEHLAELHHSSGERWREHKKAVSAARTELERKIDKALHKSE